VSESSEGDQGGGSRWLNDDKHGGEGGGGGKRVTPRGGGCSFYSWWRRLAKAARAVIGAVAAAKPWVRQNGGGHGPNAVGTSGAVVRTGRLTGGPQRFWIFSNLSKTGSTLKIKMGALSYSKNSQFLHAASRKYWERLVQLC
jgi:hypothetical protein